jgi:hypothetical protein
LNPQHRSSSTKNNGEWIVIFEFQSENFAIEGLGPTGLRGLTERDQFAIAKGHWLLFPAGSLGPARQRQQEGSRSIRLAAIMRPARLPNAAVCSSLTTNGDLPAMFRPSESKRQANHGQIGGSDESCSVSRGESQRDA